MSTSSGTEIELKLRVPDGAALRAVAAAAGGGRAAPVRQRNHFFDSAARALRQHSFGLRLRDEEGRWFLTAKGPRLDRKEQPGASAALSRKREHEIEVPDETAGAMLQGRESPLDVLERAPGGVSAAALCLSLRHLLGAEPLVYIGAFDNLRTRVTTALPSRLGPLDVVLELDETHFPKEHVHFEVEMELDEGVDAAVAELALRDLLHLAGVEGFPSRGKATRFFAALDGRTP